MEQTVTFDGPEPAWPAVGRLLAEYGFPVQLRMIDNELVFPDAAPPQGWRELRVGTPQGMVTLRRDAGRLTTVTWGNADAALVQAWNALTWACAQAGGGRVQTAAGPLAAADYRRQADLPPPLR
jgi:hypothetical protein